MTRRRRLLWRFGPIQYFYVYVTYASYDLVYLNVYSAGFALFLCEFFFVYYDFYGIGYDKV